MARAGSDRYSETVVVYIENHRQPFVVGSSGGISSFFFLHWSTGHNLPRQTQTKRSRYTTWRKPRLTAPFESLPEGESPLAIKQLKKVAREGIALAGGPAAILLQISHPKVGQGVADHSTFTTRAISRAQYTQMYIYVMILGNEDEKAAMRAWVDKAHSRVKGGEKDNAYDAMDPELQLWVAATVYASMVSMYELIYGPLPPAIGERVYQAYSIMGTLLQVPREIWPANLPAFRVYWRGMVENHLEVTVDARMVLEVLWHPNGIPFWIKPAVWVAMPFIRRTTAEQLPPAIREQFALRFTKSS